MTPMDNPDAVFSGSATSYGKPLGAGGPGRWRVLLRRLLKRKPYSQRFLIHVTYRDWTTRTSTAHLDTEKFSIRDLCEKILENENVRAVECGELLFKARKSFGADYDPANILKALDLGEAA